MSAAVGGAAIAVGLTFLIATLLQLVPAFFDPDLPRATLLPRAAAVALPLGTLLLFRLAPAVRDAAWAVTGSGVAIAAAAWLVAG